MSDNTYVVSYELVVKADKAIETIDRFSASVQGLSQLNKSFDGINQRLGRFSSSMSKLSGLDKKFSQINKHIAQMSDVFAKLPKSPLKLDIKTQESEKRLNNLLTLVRKIKKEGSSIHLGTGITSGKRGVSAAVVSTQPSVSGSRGQKLSSALYNVTGVTQLDRNGNILGRMMQGLGASYGTAALMQGIRTAITDAVSYDNMMQNTRNILETHDRSGNFQGRFSGMERTVRRVGNETKFTAPQVADAAKFLAMAGLNVDDIQSAIRPIANIALIGDTDLGQTADIVTNIMTSYNLAFDKMSRVSDVLTMTSTKANTTVVEMAEAYKYAGNMLHIAGVDFEESAAAIGLLGNAGIKASQAGTSMRTIMTNLIKPTKQQKEVISSLKLDMYDTDKDGRNRLKPLVDIFTQLRQSHGGKGATVKEMQTLIHKTAAGAALALMENVDKWNEIIDLNFLSDGIAASLAEKKKNTIQGLWYQITSAFTENGMQAFEQLDVPIKDFMKNILSWLNSKESVNALKDIGRAILFVGDKLLWITKIAVNTFDTWKTPVFVGLIAQSLFSVTLSMVRFVKGCYDVIRVVKLLGSVGIGNVVRTVITGGDLSTLAKGATDLRGTVAKGAGGKKVLTALGKGSSLVRIGLGLARFLPFVGWASLGATAIYGIYQIQKAAEAGKKAASDYATSLQLVNGIDTSKNASMSNQYLNLIYNKQGSVNDKVQEYIKLRREELGLTKEAENKESNKLSFEDAHPQFFKFGYEKLSDASDAWNAGKEFSNLFFPGAKYTTSTTFTPSIVGIGSTTNEYILDENNRYVNPHKFMGMARIAAIGSSNIEGSDAYNLMQDFQNKLNSSQSFDDIENSKKWLNSRYKELRSTIDNKYDTYTIDQFAKLPMEAIKKTRYYVESLIWRVENDLWNNKNNPAYQGVNTFIDILTDKLNGIKIPELKVSAALAVAGANLYQQGSIPFYTPVDFNSISKGTANIRELFTPKSIDASTFNRGKFVPLDWDYMKRNYYINDDGTYSAGGGNTAKENGFYARDYLNNLRNNTINIYGEEHANFLLSQTPLYNQELGKKYFGQYGSLGKTSISAEANAQNPDVGGGGVDSDGYGGAGGSYGGAGKLSSAAPKQVIVKIENLMNVERVDLSDSRKADAVRNLKTEMAQALIDVVHDFDSSWNG